MSDIDEERTLFAKLQDEVNKLRPAAGWDGTKLANRPLALMLAMVLSVEAGPRRDRTDKDRAACIVEDAQTFLAFLGADHE